MREDVRLAIETLRGMQKYFESEYDDFRVDRGLGGALEGLICELEEWGNQNG